ncbi:hypothetical protein [Scytonema millei]|uniref:Uncharacterized protein n=1 Tax=Scytonema millei VB511283 TaxID=1245923 RepID=A0A9X5I6V7_9CYAN|nr:hypothetical protein [Scytonema millei]NHC38038.1 hypothetical protein [Scytonema millei VB511283]
MLNVLTDAFKYVVGVRCRENELSLSRKQCEKEDFVSLRRLDWFADMKMIVARIGDRDRGFRKLKILKIAIVQPHCFC